MMPTEPLPPPASGVRLCSGWAASGLVIASLAFDGAAKVAGAAPVVEASEKLGVPAGSLAGIGAVLLACTAAYAAPRTAVAGALLLTGYLGGAAAIHVRAGGGAFPVAFPVAIGALAWVGLVLREPRLLRAVTTRR